MAKVVKVHIVPPVKLGARKVRKSKREKMEEMGQLNMFDQLKIVSFPQSGNFFDEALTLDEEGDPRAKEYYLKAIEHSHSIADAYCNLGILMWQQEELAKAVDCLTKSLKENPRHYEAHYNLANVYSESGSLDMAKIHFEVAIEINPDFPNSHYNLGLVYISQGRYKEAIPHIRNFVNLSPGSEHKEIHKLLETLTSLAQ